jgi:hypothetical protein
VTTHTFAEVLNVSGFEEDAFEMVRSGTEQDLSPTIARHFGISETGLAGFDMDELRNALELLAAGAPIEDLKWKISAQLYAFLQANLSKLSAAAIREGLGISGEPDEAKYESFSAVGGSLVNFPRRRFRPLSSVSFP